MGEIERWAKRIKLVFKYDVRLTNTETDGGACRESRTNCATDTGDTFTGYFDRVTFVTLVAGTTRNWTLFDS